MAHYNKQAKLISIVLPVYNGEKYLSEAIESCLIQTYKNLELIIVNDCSTDASLNIAEKYASEDQRISVISNTVNKKLPASLNLGHQKAEGELITWTSDDNILKENMLSTLLETIEATDSDLVFADYDVIESHGKYRRTHSFGPVSSLPYGSCIGACFLYRKRLYHKLEGYDEELHTLEDYDFWIRAAVNFKLYHLEESLYKYRVHKDNLTSQIRYSNDLKNLFKKKHEIVYGKLYSYLNWAPCTPEFLLMVRGFRMWDWEFFQSNFEEIINDLKKFQDSINTNDKRDILQMMDLKLRDKILNNYSDRKYLQWLFFKRPTVFIDLFYSKKTSFKIIKKLF